jgi:hypothetical protein
MIFAVISPPLLNILVTNCSCKILRPPTRALKNNKKRGQTGKIGKEREVNNRGDVNMRQKYPNSHVDGLK